MGLGFGSYKEKSDDRSIFAKSFNDGDDPEDSMEPTIQPFKHWQEDDCEDD